MSNSNDDYSDAALSRLDYERLVPTMTTLTGTDESTNPDYFALPVEDMLRASAALTIKLEELTKLNLLFGLTFDFPTWPTMDQIMALYPAPPLSSVAELEFTLWGSPVPVPQPLPTLQLVQEGPEEVRPA